jgi:hypothetical protein
MDDAQVYHGEIVSIKQATRILLDNTTGPD